MIDVTRRGLLQGILCGSLLVGLDSKVMAALPDRYAELIETQRKAIALTADWEAFKQKPDWVKLVPASSDDRFRYNPAVRLSIDMGLNRAIDDVMRVLNNRFAQVPVDEMAARRQVNALLDGEITIDTLSEDDLRKHEDYLVCVATARNMLQIHAMPLNGQTCTEWMPFVSRLKGVLASA